MNENNCVGAQTRACTYCGTAKLLTEYRPYYGGRKGRYRFCKECERIETRRKYLERRRDAGTISPAQEEELNKIYTLYEARRSHGLMSTRATYGFGYGQTASIVDTQLQRLSEDNSDDRLSEGV